MAKLQWKSISYKIWFVLLGTDPTCMFVLMGGVVCLNRNFGLPQWEHTCLSMFVLSGAVLREVCLIGNRKHCNVCPIGNYFGGRGSAFLEFKFCLFWNKSFDLSGNQRLSYLES